MTTLNILGAMTGTSCDGMDVTCVQFNKDGWQPLWSKSRPYPKAMRSRVLKLQKPGTRISLQALLELNRDLGDWYAASFKTLISGADEAPDVIANHGQTVAHFPVNLGNEGTTLQLGDPARIAQVTGLSVISDFRRGDMAAGGQGAPLATLFHHALAQHLDPDGEGIAIHNIGGISNITYIGALGEIIAFDTGPGNIWIDAAATKATSGKKAYDRSGLLAKSGKSNPADVRNLIRHPYFKKEPPKSTGRDEFSVDEFYKKTKSRGKNLVATATHATLRTIIQAYQKHILDQGLPLRRVFINGGGANNPLLVEGIRRGLGTTAEVRTLADIGFDVNFIEAKAFAYLGFYTLLGNSLGGSWTGAQDWGPPGQITPGRNWGELIEKLAWFKSGSPTDHPGQSRASHDPATKSHTQPLWDQTP